MPKAKVKKVTEKQKELLRAIEEYSFSASRFTGDIDNIKDVTEYITKWKQSLYESDNWAIDKDY